MTLVLTELSKAGIAMAADSAITKIRNGKIIETDKHQNWLKLLHVSKIKAAISYWGMIGAITKQQFDDWLKNVISSGNYTDLETFADYLVERLNLACYNKPLKPGYDVGIHLSGYHIWPDGQSRPFFYHIHNGHGKFSPKIQKDSFGKIIPHSPEWDSEPRKLFEKHQDFPNPSKTITENLADLEIGYITRNGDFFVYSVFDDAIKTTLKNIERFYNIKIPNDPSKISSRQKFLHTFLQSMILFYRCSNFNTLIGGQVTSIAIDSSGYKPKKTTCGLK